MGKIDAFRFRSRSKTKTTTFVWDPVSDCVISELNGNNNVQAAYTNEPQQYGGVLSQRRGTTTSTDHADALVYAQHGRELMGCKFPVRKRE